MSSQPHDGEASAPVAVTIEDLASRQHATEIHNLGELEADLWESDAELDEFLVDLRSSRNASLA